MIFHERSNKTTVIFQKLSNAMHLFIHHDQTRLPYPVCVVIYPHVSVVIIHLRVCYCLLLWVNTTTYVSVNIHAYIHNIQPYIFVASIKIFNRFDFNQLYVKILIHFIVWITWRKSRSRPNVLCFWKILCSFFIKGWCYWNLRGMDYFITSVFIQFKYCSCLYMTCFELLRLILRNCHLDVVVLISEIRYVWWIFFLCIKTRGKMMWFLHHKEFNLCS